MYLWIFWYKFATFNGYFLIFSCNSATLIYINCKNVDVKKFGNEKNMKISINNSKISTIAFILLLTISAIIVALPSVSAQQTQMTYPYLGVIPNPTGVNQPVLLHVGITESRSRQDLGWEGMTVTVIDPENVETILPVPKTDSTGGTGITWYPTKVGNYQLYSTFPEQTVEVTPFFFGQPYNLTYLESNSPVVDVVVQAEPIPYYPGHSLPNEYWTRPIDAQLREWSELSASWLDIPENMYSPYNDGPETAHILWTTPMTTGGLVGGSYGGHSFEIGDAYEGKFTGSSGQSFDSRPVIVAGNLYYQESTLENPIVTHCVDLRTGEERWAKVMMDNRTISFGQLFQWEGFNMHGNFAYLWIQIGGGGYGGGTSDWYAFDPFTGDWLMTYEDVPSGTNIFGPNGEILRYSTSGGMLRLWNSTTVVMDGIGPPDSGSWGDNAHGRTHNATIFDYSVPYSAPGSLSRYWYNDEAVGASVSQEQVRVYGISTKPENAGTLLFDNTWEAPDYWAAGNVSLGFFGGGIIAWSQEDKVAVLFIQETREHYAFSLETGECLWGPSEPQYYLDALDDTDTASTAVAYGRLYRASVGGIIYCYDIQTGDLEWSYEVRDPYKEILWCTSWWQKPVFITDGKIYCGTLEHSPIDPRPRGGAFVCLNATTGDVIWRANGLFRQTRWGGRAIIGDSVMATMDTYDQRVYAVGKGPSATTVSAPEVTQSVSTPVLIQGTVMDVSPGTEDIKVTMRFPNGVPAISDASMSDWMLYVYKQFEMPADAIGVEVILNAVDESGVWHDIDRVNTDMSGSFSYRWTPGVEGKYTIVATFVGSGGYFGSYAETAISVGPSTIADSTEFPYIPTSEEIAADAAQRTIAMLPPYPDVPTQEAIADDAARRTIAMLPAYPECNPCPEIPAYSIIELVLIVLVVVGIVIGVYAAVIKKK